MKLLVFVRTGKRTERCDPSRPRGSILLYISSRKTLLLSSLGQGRVLITSRSNFEVFVRLYVLGQLWLFGREFLTHGQKEIDIFFGT